MNLVKSEKEIAIMREGGKILATVLGKSIKSIKPGVTTQDIADIAKEEVKRLGGEPSFYDYSGYPAVICISINEEVVHGLPGPRVIKDGDVVSLDFGVKYKGLVTDAARTVLIGPPDKKKMTLIDATRQAFEDGLAAVKAGAYIGDIGAAVQTTLESHGFGVVRALVGHGVGRKVHEPPEIPNYGKAGTGMELKAGMTLAIEPMSTLGAYDVYTAADGWTIVTKDGSLSAHYEETIVVTKKGAEVLTKVL